MDRLDRRPAGNLLKVGLAPAAVDSEGLEVPVDVGLAGRRSR